MVLFGSCSFTRVTPLIETLVCNSVLCGLLSTWYGEFSLDAVDGIDESDSSIDVVGPIQTKEKEILWIESRNTRSLRKSKW